MSMFMELYFVVNNLSLALQCMSSGITKVPLRLVMVLLMPLGLLFANAVLAVRLKGIMFALT